MYAMHAMYEFGWTVRQWSEMTHKERITTIAMIQVHKELEDEAQKDAERKAKSKSRSH